MKRKTILFVIFIASSALISSCAKDSSKTNQLSSDQLKSLEQMNAHYNLAKTYNDSLFNCSKYGSSTTATVIHYDSCYHANDSQFNHCQQQMTTMMSESGSMMGNGMSGGKCSKNCNTDEVNQVVTKMNALRATHTINHPVIN